MNCNIGWLAVFNGGLRKVWETNDLGAGTKIRTRDLLITNQLLYQLSYTGSKTRGRIF